MRVLVIEDDLAIGRALVKGFTEAGYQCDWMQDGETGVAAAKSQQADAIVLDQMLPKVSGLELLREIRDRSHDTRHPADGNGIRSGSNHGTEYWRRRLYPETVRFRGTSGPFKCRGQKNQCSSHADADGQ